MSAIWGAWKGIELAVTAFTLPGDITAISRALMSDGTVALIPWAFLTLGIVLVLWSFAPERESEMASDDRSVHVGRDNYGNINTGDTKFYIDRTPTLDEETKSEFLARLDRARPVAIKVFGQKYAGFGHDLKAFLKHEGYRVSFSGGGIINPPPRDKTGVFETDAGYIVVLNEFG